MTNRGAFRWGHGSAQQEIRKGDGTRSAFRPDVGACRRFFFFFRAAQGASQRGRASPLSCSRFNVDERELAVEWVVAGILLVSWLGLRMFSTPP